MALSGATQCGRNPALGALAGHGASGADDDGSGYSLDGAGARVRLFALAVLAADRLFRACGGSDGAGALPAGVDHGFSSGGARRGHHMAGADLHVRDGAARALLSIPRVRDGGGSVSLGAVGDGGYRVYGGGVAVGRSLRGASGIGIEGGSMAASGAPSAAGCERAGTGTAAAVHVFVLSDCARILAGLHVGEPEESAGGARRDHARSQFGAGGSRTHRNHAADSR